MKSSYKIPASLASGYMNMEMSLQTKDGIGRIFPLKLVITYLISLFGVFYILFQSPLKRGTLLEKLIFFVVWVIWTIVLTRTDKTDRMRWQMIPSLLSYLPNTSRRIITRSNSKADPFWGLVGIKDIGRRGLIEYADGTFGYMYSVVGSASILLFDGDQRAIVNRVDKWYRKIAPDTECIFITTKETQKIHNQLYHLKQLNENLVGNDPDLRALLQERFDILKYDVGSRYRSIHHYLILKSDNEEALRIAQSVLRSEVENSTLMMKRCLPLTTPDQIQGVLSGVYRGLE